MVRIVKGLATTEAGGVGDICIAFTVVTDPFSGNFVAIALGFARL